MVSLNSKFAVLLKNLCGSLITRGKLGSLKLTHQKLASKDANKWPKDWLTSRFSTMRTSLFAATLSNGTTALPLAISKRVAHWWTKTATRPSLIQPQPFFWLMTSCTLSLNSSVLIWMLALWTASWHCSGGATCSKTSWSSQPWSLRMGRLGLFSYPSACSLWTSFPFTSHSSTHL